MRTPLSLALAACLVAALSVPVDAWSQFRFVGTSGSSSNSSTSTSTTVNLVALTATANTVAGPASFTDDRSNPEQNTIYEVFGGAAADVCLTLQNRGRLGDMKTIVDGATLGDNVKPQRTRTRCFTAPSTIELSCTSSACEAVWRIDAL